jgi:hypothetical protein
MTEPNTRAPRMTKGRQTIRKGGSLTGPTSRSIKLWITNWFALCSARRLRGPLARCLQT